MIYGPAKGDLGRHPFEGLVLEIEIRVVSFEVGEGPLAMSEQEVEVERSADEIPKMEVIIGHEAKLLGSDSMAGLLEKVQTSNFVG